MWFSNRQLLRRTLQKSRSPALLHPYNLSHISVFQSLRPPIVANFTFSAGYACLTEVVVGKGYAL